MDIDQMRSKLRRRFARTYGILSERDEHVVDILVEDALSVILEGMANWLASLRKQEGIETVEGAAAELRYLMERANIKKLPGG